MRMHFIDAGDQGAAGAVDAGLSRRGGTVVGSTAAMTLPCTSTDMVGVSDEVFGSNNRTLRMRIGPA